MEIKKTEEIFLKVFNYSQEENEILNNTRDYGKLLLEVDTEDSINIANELFTLINLYVADVDLKEEISKEIAHPINNKKLLERMRIMCKYLKEECLIEINETSKRN